MPVVVFLLLSCVLGFLIGGIPFGFLVGKFVVKDDIRSYGSGNIGATNVGRILGWYWGALVLILDAIKGLIPTVAAAWLSGFLISPEWWTHMAVAAGMSSVIGHMYPVYLQLRGGKGVATALGVVMVLAPQALGMALVVFVVVMVLTHQVALGSILASSAFCAAYLLLNWDHAWNTSSASQTAFAVCVPLLIIWRHRSNIRRMLAGTEPRVTEHTESADSEDGLRVLHESAEADEV
ncbi:MAG: glycerol-3-phosphate 1-O-acyltransferase PlsY [Fuerstiella sp.]|nr:glycerol-3-phosphate 1-O-acyltransferase PlsY [Fuerstiella sp.]